jgi:hypothetical protein
MEDAFIHLIEGSEAADTVPTRQAVA